MWGFGFVVCFCMGLVGGFKCVCLFVFVGGFCRLIYVGFWVLFIVFVRCVCFLIFFICITRVVLLGCAFGVCCVGVLGFLFLLLVWAGSWFSLDYSVLLFCCSCLFLFC